MARTSREPEAEQDPSDLAEPCPGGFRQRIRCLPVIGPLYRLCVFVVGALFIAIGLALSVLPGPLTIPPVLLGVWIWSTEFHFARRLREQVRRRAAAALRQARAHVVRSTVVTVCGLLGAAVAVWVIRHYQLLAWAREDLLP